MTACGVQRRDHPSQVVDQDLARRGAHCERLAVGTERKRRDRLVKVDRPELSNEVVQMNEAGVVSLEQDEREMTAWLSTYFPWTVSKKMTRPSSPPVASSTLLTGEIASDVAAASWCRTNSDVSCPVLRSQTRTEPSPYVEPSEWRAYGCGEDWIAVTL